MSAVPVTNCTTANSLNEGLPSYDEAVASNVTPKENMIQPASSAIISQPKSNANKVQNEPETDDIQYSSFCGDCSTCCTYNTNSTSEPLFCCLLCQICCDVQGECCTALNECVGFCVIETCAGVEGCCECVAACCEGFGGCCTVS